MRVSLLCLLGMTWLGACAADGEPTIAQGTRGDRNRGDGDEASSDDDESDTDSSEEDDSQDDSSSPDASGPGGDGDDSTSMNPRKPSKEVCDTGIDEDLDGLVDEDCPCTAGATQACYFGPKESAGELCPAGMQRCVPGEFPVWGPCASTGADFPDDLCECFPEICGNDKDDNCNGQADEGCAVDVPVNIDGDCVTAECPAWAPYPVGCDLVMEGGDSRGCVASTPNSPVVYFQEGDACPILGGIFGEDSGNISGNLLCSSQQGAPLNATSCALNKSEKLYPASADACP